MTCRKARWLASLAARGELKPEERERLKGHLGDCAACRRANLDARGVDDLLRSSLRYTPMGLDLRPAVMRQLDSRPRRSPWRDLLRPADWWLLPRWMPTSAGLAAACLLVGIVGWWRVGGGTGGSSPAPGNPDVARVETPAGMGSALRSGQTVRHADLGDGRIRMRDGTLLTLDRTAVVRMRRDGVVLERGRLLAAVAPQQRDFVVVTDAAETRVLGTEFTVERRPSGSTLVTVLKGTVRVRNRAGEQVLRANRFTVARKDLRPLPPEPIDAAAVTEWANLPTEGPSVLPEALPAEIDVTRRQLAAERRELDGVRKQLSRVKP